MESKNKAVKNYTREQIEQLCQDLTNKVSNRYKEEGKSMDFTKSTIANYQVLADAISEKCEQHQFAIKAAWLRELFITHRQQTTTMLASIFVESCCAYLGTNESAYFEKLEALHHGYLGKYQVYWKGTTNNNADIAPFCEYDLELTKHTSSFVPVVAHKTIIFTGEPPSVQQGHVYVELVHPNQTERFFMIFHIGNTEKDLDVLSALVLCVNTTPRPCALHMLLVRHGKIVTDEFIQEYFRRYRSNGLLKGSMVHTIQNMLLDLQERSLEMRRLSGLQGSWLLYLLDQKKEGVERVKLHIGQHHRVRCESSLHTYTNGSLELLGGTLKIELRNPVAYSVLLLQVGMILKLENIRQPIKALYLTNGRIQPESGVGALVRSEIPYEQVEVPYFIKPNSEEYEQLRLQGIIDLLE